MIGTIRRNQNLIKTDIFHRGVPWMLLVLSNREMPSDLNLSYKSRAATVLAGLLGLSLLILILSGHAAALLPAAAFLLGAAIGTRHNVKTLFAVALAILAPLFCYWLVPDPLALIPITLVLAIVATHLAFYLYIARKRNGAFAIAVAPMQVVFFLCCAIAVPIAFIQHHLQKG